MKDYNFSTETFLIPCEDSERSLRRKIFFFEEEYNDPSTLLLVYYGGHGVLDYRNRSIWAEFDILLTRCLPITDNIYRGTSGDSPMIEWFSIQCQLEKSPSDVVLILDCCFAGSADATSLNANIHVLSACGRENDTISPGDWSFTSRLVEVLKDWSERSFTIAQLHAELLNMRTLIGYRKLRRSPQHYIQDKNKCSVRVARIFSLDSENPSLTPGWSSSEESLPLPPSAKEPRVLFSVSVDGSAKEDPLAWLEWLRSHMPDYIRAVNLEGLFGSHSTLGIFSIPVRAWGYIPDNAAYSFIGFTTTSNLLVENPSPTILPPNTGLGSALALRYSPTPRKIPTAK